jgi:perosamine synthetase
MSEDPNILHKRATGRVAEYVATMLEMPDAFRGQQLRGAGPVAEFETLLAQRSGFPFCLATSNATTGLLLAALATNLEGKEIIVPPHSWSGTYGPFEFAGARLIFAEEDADGNIASSSVEKLVTSSTAAVVAADWNGARHDTRGIRAMCNTLNLLYIEDTSFIPSLADDQAACSLADIQIISFGPGKRVTLGEGGALLTRHRWIYERAVALSQHPERCSSEGMTAYPERSFLNGRIHPVAAVLGVALLTAELSSTRIHINCDDL